MTFGEALELLKAGKHVARRGWNGKNMFLFLVSGNTTIDFRRQMRAAVEHAKAIELATSGCDSPESVYINPHIDMKAADGTIVVGWLASQTDMLFNDWYCLEPNE